MQEKHDFDTAVVSLTVSIYCSLTILQQFVVFCFFF